MLKKFIFPYLLLIILVGVKFVICSEDQEIASIAGGKTAKLGQFPYQVAILNRERPICSGALAQTATGSQYVITAAHCLRDYSSRFRILAGSTTLKGRNPTAQIGRIRKIAIHPEYKWPSPRNDFALIFLENDFTLNNDTNPINLPSQSQEFTGNLTVSGWGSTQYKPAACPRFQLVTTFLWEESPNQLQYTTVSIIPNWLCRYLYGACYPPEPVIFPCTMCAFSMQGGLDSCQGETGSPAVAEFRGEKILFGIVAWGEGCGAPGYPGVYMKVSHFIDWIHQQTMDSTA